MYVNIDICCKKAHTFSAFKWNTLYYSLKNQLLIFIEVNDYDNIFHK